MPAGDPPWERTLRCACTWLCDARLGPGSRPRGQQHQGNGVYCTVYIGEHNTHVCTRDNITSDVVRAAMIAVDGGHTVVVPDRQLHQDTNGADS